MNKIQHLSASLLRPYLRYAKQLGVDVDAVLAEYGGIAQQVEDNNYARVPADSLRPLLSNITDASGDPFFGLNAAREIQQDIFGLLGYILINSPNLFEFWRNIDLYYSLINDVNVMILHGDRPPFFLACEMPAVSSEHNRHALEHTMASWSVFCERFVGLEIAAAEVHFRHARPDLENAQSVYEEVFKAPVVFEQERNGLLVSSELAYEPIRQADARLLELLLARAGEMKGELEVTQPFTYLVRCAIGDLLSSGPISRQRVADRLHMGDRTLQRRLVEEGVSFRDLVNEVKHELALKLVRADELSIEEVSQRVGFTDARSFQRSFKQWTGCTVGQYRTEQGV